MIKQESKDLNSRIKSIRLAKPELWKEPLAFSRQLRKEHTGAEKALWQVIKGRRLCGVKFRRQHVIDRFVVDFFSPEIDLIIEVDGEVHEFSVDEDRARQHFLELLGFTVLRFSNDEVQNDISEVIQQITGYIQTFKSKAISLQGN